MKMFRIVTDYVLKDDEVIALLQKLRITCAGVLPEGAHIHIECRDCLQPKKALGIGRARKVEYLARCEADGLQDLSVGKIYTIYMEGNFRATDPVIPTPMVRLVNDAGVYMWYYADHFKKIIAD